MISVFKNTNDFVFKFYKQQSSAKLTYHNQQHTLTLLDRANQLFESEALVASDMAIVQFALLFSETGYSVDYNNPISGSLSVFEDFCKIESIQMEAKAQVKGCIQALKTKKPANVLEEVTLDVFYSDYGRKKYQKYNSLLRREIKEKLGQEYSELEWISFQINQISSHRFYTNYAINNWEGRKRKNLAKLLNSKNDKSKVKFKEKTKAYYKQKYKNESPERGIQTLYRVALRNHIKLSDIADTKANILLSVNAIIISLVLANVISQFNNPENRFMILPTIIFVVFSIISMVMSIKATQPNVTRGEFTEKDIKNKNVNLAFFGNFHRMELSKYQSAFSDLIKNKDDVYNTLTIDLYFLGSVLDSKYRLLRYTYLVFMIGIIVSVIAFAISFIYRDVATL